MVKKLIKIAFYLILLSIVLWAISSLMNQPKSENLDVSNIAIKQR